MAERSPPLISAEQLLETLDGPDVRIADTRWYLGEPGRGRKAYEAGHIPGAVYVDLEMHLSAGRGPGRHPLPSPAEFAATVAELGRGSASTVVAYDDRGGAVAARMWWMLRGLGIDARILDGGLVRWRALGYPETDQPVPLEPATPVVAPPTWRGTADRQAVAAGIGRLQLVDARSAPRYRGDEEPIDPVAGHIPSAVNAPYEENLDEDHRFKSAGMLLDRFAAAGLDPAAPTVAYCGSGVTACHDILALELAGFRDVRLYPGSWSDWATTGGEVARSS